MDVFLVFQIAQMVLNRAEHHANVTKSGKAFFNLVSNLVSCKLSEVYLERFKDNCPQEKLPPIVRIPFETNVLS